ncbi:protein AGENET DOMAIN (AGD)-CONTAINING P1-like [Henckelia pumila]|uniref:protein AGENET DOMAIN (AGD)-CONTAINING P1-like n=1 Tax=Henckelia pumila TaxID=405737 RepID=UPI003C6E2447
MMYFQQGDRVEVASKEVGFVGSYYEATVVGTIPRRNKYVVEHKITFVKDEYMSSTAPLREVVHAIEVRPRPPEMYMTEFRLGDRVDVFDDDGWWVGTVKGADFDEGKYYVYLKILGFEICYHVERLRVHQDWKNGTWTEKASDSELRFGLELTSYVEGKLVVMVGGMIVETA